MSLFLFMLIRRFTVAHRRWACLLVVALPVLLRLSLLPLFPIPEPLSHDEFSYLLGADTFTSGRLTNPVHPLWVHFETIHVNQQPTYATKYPPGQPLFLALGQRFLGHPWYGVLLSVSFMSGCVYWMLRSWLPPPYPFLGALLGSIQFGVATYWGNSYWGGAIAAAGGALVAGALPLLARRPSTSAALFGAIGVAVLALTRPYEGLVFVALCAFVLIWWRHKERRPVAVLLSPKIVLPVAVTLSLTFAWFGYYNYRVAGKPWLMPYVVNNRAYAANPVFWILPEGAVPEYRHEIIRKVWVLRYRETYRKVRSNPFRTVQALGDVRAFYLPAPVLVLVSIAAITAKTRKVRVALMISSMLAMALLVETTVSVHYYAPATGLVLLLALVGTRYIIQAARRYRQVADCVLVLLIVVTLGGLGMKSLDRYRSLNRTGNGIIRRLPGDDFPSQRRAIINELVESGSQHLVIVRYAPQHSALQEWVYNRANIDGAQIVWAHDMGEKGNLEILDYYRNRKIWLLEPDVVPPRLTEYSRTFAQR
jgi:hypothetical protein